MSTNPDYLIVYGTLRPPFANPFAQLLRQYGHPIGEATFPGVLFNIETPGAESYPGTTYQPNAATTVVGTVYDIGLPEDTVLKYLDGYERVGHADETHGARFGGGIKGKLISVDGTTPAGEIALRLVVPEPW